MKYLQVVGMVVKNSACWVVTKERRHPHTGPGDWLRRKKEGIDTATPSLEPGLGVALRTGKGGGKDMH